LSFPPKDCDLFVANDDRALLARTFATWLPSFGIGSAPPGRGASVGASVVAFALLRSANDMDRLASRAAGGGVREIAASCHAEPAFEVAVGEDAS
jgi:hypothetical protein